LRTRVARCPTLPAHSTPIAAVAAATARRRRFAYSDPIELRGQPGLPASWSFAVLK
jgi:hypothetical protein